MRSFGNRDFTIFPNCIEISEKDEILVGNSHGNYFHIAVYSKWGKVLGEYKCPYAKVCIKFIIISKN